MSFLEKFKKPDATEDEIMTDRAFMRGIITSFFAIAMCIIMLGASTYAWFTTSIQSTQTITSAVYVLSITIDGGENAYLHPTGEVDGNYVYTFEAGTTYTVTATAIANDSTNGKTGYVKLIVDDKSFVSQQIDRGDEITFTLKFTEETEVTFVEGWGTSSAEVRDLIDGGEYENLQ